MTAQRIVTICNKKGLHARAAAKFVKCADQYESPVFVKRHIPPSQGELLESEDQQVSARSILGLMMLGAGRGTQIELSADGVDAEEAVDALVRLIENRFEEDE